MGFFVPDVVLFGDPAGFGRWLTSHFLEHKQFITSALALTTPVTVPDYDLLAYSDEPRLTRFWLDAHALVHNTLRSATGVTGIDLQEVDFTKADQFEIWLSDHALEHAQIRAVFKIT